MSVNKKMYYILIPGQSIDDVTRMGNTLIESPQVTRIVSVDSGNGKVEIHLYTFPLTEEEIINFVCKDLRQGQSLVSQPIFYSPIIHQW